MAQWSERAFDVVTEITKQVLTLAAGIIALTITFLKDFAPNAAPAAKHLIAWSWGVYIVSILAGFMTLMASAGLQQKAATTGTAPDINAGNLRVLGGIQLITFDPRTSISSAPWAPISSSTTRRLTSSVAGGATTSSSTPSGTDPCPISDVGSPRAARRSSPGLPVWRT